MAAHYYLPTRVIYGTGCLADLPARITVRRLLVLCSGTLRRQGLLDRLLAEIAVEAVTIFAEVEPNPSYATVDRASELARAFRADGCLAVGGGSVLDVAKAVTCLTTHAGRITEYLDGERHFSLPRPPLFAVPTTAGTGSEVTPFGVYSDTVRQQKRLLQTPAFYPDIAVVDPALTRSLPPAVTAATGLDALCHALEAYWSVTAQPITDQYCLQAIAGILTYLPRAWEHGDDMTAREQMAVGSLLAGMAFSQTMTNACHAMSYALTANYDVPHGFACALTLPAFTRHIALAIPEKFDRLLSAVNLPTCEHLTERISAVMRHIHAPTRLAEVGVDGDAIEALCEAAVGTANLRLAPRAFSHTDLQGILDSLR